MRSGWLALLGITCPIFAVRNAFRTPDVDRQMVRKARYLHRRERPCDQGTSLRRRRSASTDSRETTA